MIPLLVALAGGLGAATRFWLDGTLRGRSRAVGPWATVVINVTGSFLLGLLVASAPDGAWHDVLGTGFLGGYTTFSAASVEALRLAQGRQGVRALVH
ncbi:fluoride efflux transporter FluC, partial [Aeromicrobium sp. Root495]|uniref:fluoride efflux transporter FluC n=1 Tax=Aeromicrobium sp. Root495 TaxID=1736550 RepID=UPI001910C853